MTSSARPDRRQRVAQLVPQHREEFVLVLIGVLGARARPSLCLVQPRVLDRQRGAIRQVLQQRAIVVGEGVVLVVARGGDRAQCPPARLERDREQAVDAKRLDLLGDQKARSAPPSLAARPRRSAPRSRCRTPCPRAPPRAACGACRPPRAGASAARDPDRGSSRPPATRRRARRGQSSTNRPRGPAPRGPGRSGRRRRRGSPRRGSATLPPAPAGVPSIGARARRGPRGAGPVRTGPRRPAGRRPSAPRTCGHARRRARGRRYTRRPLPAERRPTSRRRARPVWRPAPGTAGPAPPARPPAPPPGYEPRRSPASWPSAGSGSTAPRSAPRNRWRARSATTRRPATAGKRRPHPRRAPPGPARRLARPWTPDRRRRTGSWPGVAADRSTGRASVSQARSFRSSLRRLRDWRSAKGRVTQAQRRGKDIRVAAASAFP